MRAYLIKSDKLRIANIPEETSGSFWITDYDEYGKEVSLICVKKDEENFVLISNEDVVCVENRSEVSSINIEFYKFNHIMFILVKY